MVKYITFGEYQTFCLMKFIDIVPKVCKVPSPPRTQTQAVGKLYILIHRLKTF